MPSAARILAAFRPQLNCGPDSEARGRAYAASRAKIKLAEKLGLKVMKPMDYYFIHDYDLLNEYSGRHI